MKTIRFNCIHCIGRLEVDSKGCGLTVPCPLCKQPVKIPDHVSMLEQANRLLISSAEKITKCELYDYIAVSDLRSLLKTLGYRACFGDTHHDFSDSTRLNLVLKINVSFMRESSRWRMDQDTDVLDAFPAQELIRVESRNIPRDWQARWVAAGGKLITDGRMIALKTDPIWKSISTFGTPWPPFDIGSGMDLRAMSRQETVMYGLLKTTERVTPCRYHPVVNYILIEDDRVTDYFKRLEPEDDDFDDDIDEECSAKQTIQAGTMPVE